MPLTIPESEQSSFAELLRLTDEHWKLFAEAGNKVPPTLSVDSFSSAIASLLPTTLEDPKRLVQFLISLFSVRQQFSGTDQEFFTELRHAAKNSGKADLDPDKSNWAAFTHNLQQLFAEESSIGVSAKAIGLAAEHERLFLDARITSDLRPLFHMDVEASPGAMAITHTLRLSFVQDRKGREIFIALDTDDLRNLQSTISRALKKERSLTALLRQKDIDVVNTNDEDK